MTTEGKNPGIPLTKLDLQNIGRGRLSKQLNKRLLFILGPALFAAILGLALHRSNGLDLGFGIIILAMLGALVGMLMVIRWYNGEVSRFVRNHAGSFWKKLTPSPDKPKTV